MSATKRRARQRTAWCCIRRATTTRSSFFAGTGFIRTISEGSRESRIAAPLVEARLIARCRRRGGRESLRKPAVFYGFMRTGEIEFQKAVMARGFQGPRQQPLCRLTDGQIAMWTDACNRRTRRLATATLAHLIDIMARAQRWISGCTPIEPRRRFPPNRSV
jgi:hypothetical protein